MLTSPSPVNAGMLTAVSYEDLTRATMAAVTLRAVAMPQAEDSLFGTLSHFPALPSSCILFGHVPRALWRAR